MFDTLLPEKSIIPAHPWANKAGRRNKNAFTFVLKLLIISQIQILDVKDVVWVVKMWFVVVWWWFGANMAGQRNTYAFKFLLHLLILS